jgi:imidazolonepropionase-like amidohydrolase
MKYDLLIRGGRVVDPKNKIKGQYDLGIEHGAVVDVAPGLYRSQAREIIDLSGYTLMPGVVDAHVHLRQRGGHRQVVKAGVCTCLEMTDMHQVIRDIPAYGCGLNIAGLETMPGFPKDTPPMSELVSLVEKALEVGAVGVKILGPSHVSTPEATRAMMEAANRAGAYVAYHATTTQSNSDLGGLLETVELAGSNHLHIAHINSYLRGLVRDPVEEAMMGLNALKGKRNLVTESYLSVINGTSGRVIDGVVNLGARNNLQKGGYELTEKGLEQAIMDGYGQVLTEEGGDPVFLTGAKGVAGWRERDTNVGMSFPVNSPESSFLCAVKKDEAGNFIIDAISTDGGLVPRNVAVERGLALVRYKALTLEEFITKTSTRGAAMLGLPEKGHLGIGADADITVLDVERGRPVMTIVAGKIAMAHGVVYGTGGTVITTEKGARAVKDAGVPYRVVDVQNMLIYSKSGQAA